MPVTIFRKLFKVYCKSVFLLLLRLGISLCLPVKHSWPGCMCCVYFTFSVCTILFFCSDNIAYRMFIVLEVVGPERLELIKLTKSEVNSLHPLHLRGAWKHNPRIILCLWRSWGLMSLVFSSTQKFDSILTSPPFYFSIAEYPEWFPPEML